MAVKFNPFTSELDLVGSSGGGSGTVESVVAGDDITVDNTDAANPVVSVTADTFQPLDAELSSLAGLTPGAEGRMITSNGLGGYQISTPGDVRSYLNVEDGAEANVVDSVNTQTGAVVLDADDISDATTTNKFTNATDIARLANTSGTNTGDQVVPTTEDIQDIAGAMVSGNTETNITVTYQDADGTIDFSVANASTSARGVVELATTAETQTGTDTGRAVTPDGLHDMTSLAGAGWIKDEDDMASNDDTKVPTQQSVKAYADTKIASSYLDTDGTLTANSDTKIASQKATKTYADTKYRGSVSTSEPASPSNGDLWYDSDDTSYDDGNSFIYNETPSGTVNGTNTVFDTANNFIAGTIQVFRDGQLMKGGGNDYTETDSNTITFTTAPTTGSVLLVSYQQAVSPSGNADTLDGQHAPTGTIVGTTDTQTLTNKTIDGDDNTLQDIPYSAIKESAWTSWTPTWSNITVGDGTSSGAYVVIGKTVHFRAYFKMGSTSSITGNVTLTMPISATSSYPQTTYIGPLKLWDNSGQIVYAGNIYQSGLLLAFVVTGSSITHNTITSSNPFTWATDDYIVVAGTYEAA